MIKAPYPPLHLHFNGKGPFIQAKTKKYKG